MQRAAEYSRCQLRIVARLRGFRLRSSHGQRLFRFSFSLSLIASTLSLTDVRHLVVEDMMMKQKQGKTFIPNSLHMDCFLFLSFLFSS